MVDGKKKVERKRSKKWGDDSAPMTSNFQQKREKPQAVSPTRPLEVGGRRHGVPGDIAKDWAAGVNDRLPLYDQDFEVYKLG